MVKNCCCPQGLQSEVIGGEGCGDRLSRWVGIWSCSLLLGAASYVEERDPPLTYSRGGCAGAELGACT